MYQQICIIFFSLLYSQLTTFLNCDTLRKEKGHMRRGGSGFQARSWLNESSEKVQTYFPNQVYIYICLHAFSKFFIYFSTGLLFFVKISVLGAQTNNPLWFTTKLEWTILQDNGLRNNTRSTVSKTQRLALSFRRKTKVNMSFFKEGICGRKVV